jgi:hypothetical protein
VLWSLPENRRERLASVGRRQIASLDAAHSTRAVHELEGATAEERQLLADRGQYCYPRAFEKHVPGPGREGPIRQHPSELAVEQHGAHVGAQRDLTDQRDFTAW